MVGIVINRDFCILLFMHPPSSVSMIRNAIQIDTPKLGKAIKNVEVDITFAKDLMFQMM